MCGGQWTIEKEGHIKVWICHKILILKVEEAERRKKKQNQVKGLSVDKDLCIPVWRSGPSQALVF